MYVRILIIAVIAAMSALLPAGASAAFAPPLVGGPADCSVNPFCDVGLRHVYGVTVRGHYRTVAPGAAMYRALYQRKVTIAVAFSTDPQLNNGKQRVLRDDLKMTGADNIVPVMEKDLVTAYGTALTDRINVISDGLTTAQLRRMNGRVAAGVSVVQVANAYLIARGLGGSAPDTIAGPEIRLIAQAFPESRLLAQVFARGLNNAGYATEVTQANGFRSRAYDELRYRRSNMSIEYAASLTEFLAGNIGFRSRDIDETMTVLQEWLAKDGLVAARPAAAVNTNVFIVLPRIARARRLTKLSDLRSQGLTLVPRRAPATATQATPSASQASNPTMQLGSFGPEVRALQIRLRRLGFYSGEIDSSFGNQTRLAVIAFQSDRGLVADGIVGRQTRAAILQAIAALD